MIRLRRDGMRPLCFSGHLIVQHDGWLPGARLWHDLFLYRVADGGFAVAIIARLGGGPDARHASAVRCHAAQFDSLDRALTSLESHDAAADLCPGMSAPALDTFNPALSATVLRLQAARLQDFCRDVVSRYEAGAGAILYAACRSGL